MLVKSLFHQSQSINQSRARAFLSRVCLAVYISVRSVSLSALDAAGRFIYQIILRTMDEFAVGATTTFEGRPLNAALTPASYWID